MSPTIQARPERGTWRVVVQRGGKRVRRECKTLAEAEDLCRALEARETALDDWLFYVRSDFMADGVHPTSQGVDKISDEMVSWCVGDPMCAPLALPEPPGGLLTGLVCLGFAARRRGNMTRGPINPPLRPHSVCI